jgi:hypothetical protein
LALEALPQLDLPARTVREIAALTISVNCWSSIQDVFCIVTLMASF